VNETGSEAHSCHEAQHVFRVRHGCGDEQFVTADYVEIHPTGLVQLRVRSGIVHDMVAVFFPTPGLEVTRVDMLFTKEGLKET
jgi:hypothetical protein